MSEIMYPAFGAAILHEAQELLRERGWAKFNLENEHGLCAIGAICFAARRQTLAATDAMEALRREILLETGGSSITTWNDFHANTVEDILLLFKRAEDYCHEQLA